MNIQEGRFLPFGNSKYPITDIGPDEELELSCPRCASDRTWEWMELRQFGLIEDVIVLLTVCEECGYRFGSRFKLDHEIAVE